MFAYPWSNQLSHLFLNFLSLSKKLTKLYKGWNKLTVYNPHAIVWIFVFHQNSYVKMLTPENDGTFGRWQVMRVAPSWVGLVLLYFCCSSEIPWPFYNVRTQREGDGYKWEHQRWPCQCLNLGLPGSMSYEQYISVVYKLSSLWCFVIAAQRD